MKETRHERANAFRQSVAFPTQRNTVIREFLCKESFDESDQQRIMLLFQKASYLTGCEDGYRLLIEKIRSSGDEKLQRVTIPFASKLEVK